ncbi:MAG: type II toxin-antitoxin system RelE/ParE family toxin [Thermomicrobiales bacterium]
MSPRKRRLALKPQARTDVKDALLHTREPWGVEQRNRYSALLDQALLELVVFPEIGRSRDELYFGCRSRPVGQHIVYDHLTETAIVVTRVLHSRQDPSGKLEP